MISTYSGVLSAIEKTLQKLVEKYQEVRRSLQDLVEGQERNMAQLERIGATIEWKWSSEEESRKEENGDKEKRSENGPGKSQEERTLSSAFC